MSCAPAAACSCPPPKASWSNSRPRRPRSTSSSATWVSAPRSSKSSAPAHSPSDGTRARCTSSDSWMRQGGDNARPKLRAALLLLAVALLLFGTAWLTRHRRAGPNDESPAAIAALSSPADAGAAPDAGYLRAPGTARTPKAPTDPGAPSGTPSSPAAPATPALASNGAPHAGNTASPPASGNHGDASDGEESKLFPKDWRRCFGWSGGAREAYDFAADSSTYS